MIMLIAADIESDVCRRWSEKLCLCLDEALKMVSNGCNAKRATVKQLQQQLEEVEKDLTSRLQTIDCNCSRMTVRYCRSYSKCTD